MDVKEQLRRFAAEAGFLRESQVERCLASAAIDMVLADASLRSRLLSEFEVASVKDIQAIRAGACPSVPSSPAPAGTVAASAAANSSLSKESNS
jgi:hypothetical protein